MSSAVLLALTVSSALISLVVAWWNHRENIELLSLARARDRDDLIVSTAEQGWSATDLHELLALQAAVVPVRDTASGRFRVPTPRDGSRGERRPAVAGGSHRR